MSKKYNADNINGIQFYDDKKDGELFTIDSVDEKNVGFFRNKDKQRLNYNIHYVLDLLNHNVWVEKVDTNPLTDREKELVSILNGAIARMDKAVSVLRAEDYYITILDTIDLKRAMKKAIGSGSGPSKTE